jgi:hypothetical protein
MVSVEEEQVCIDWSASYLTNQGGQLPAVVSVVIGQVHYSLPQRDWLRQSHHRMPLIGSPRLGPLDHLAEKLLRH